MSIALSAIALLAALTSTVSAHGLVQGILADGIWYPGYSPSYQYVDPSPVVIGWSIPEDSSTGFIDPANYTTQNIICHLDATPGGASAKVTAGSAVELQWTIWPESHHGPVIDYLAKCPGRCEDVDKTKLEFFKIDEVGLISEDDQPYGPGVWASDQLIANNNSWTVTIPKSIEPGNYVLRHEIIALHSANNADGAQNYPQCLNIEITGSGTDSPSGVPATEFYKQDDPGILVNIYTSLSTYKIPGPTLISNAVSMSQTTLPINGGATVTSSSISTSAAAASSTPASNGTQIAYSSSQAPPSTKPMSSSTPGGSSSAAAAVTTTTTSTSTASNSAPASYSSPLAAASTAVASTPPAATTTAPYNPCAAGMISNGEQDEYTRREIVKCFKYMMNHLAWKTGNHARDFQAR